MPFLDSTLLGVDCGPRTSSSSSSSSSVHPPSSSSAPSFPTTVLPTTTELSEFCEFVIASLFEVAPSSPSRTHRPAFGREGIDTPPYTPPLDGQPRKEPPVLVEFIVSRNTTVQMPFFLYTLLYTTPHHPCLFRPFFRPTPSSPSFPLPVKLSGRRASGVMGGGPGPARVSHRGPALTEGVGGRGRGGKRGGTSVGVKWPVTTHPLFDCQPAGKRGRGRRSTHPHSYLTLSTYLPSIVSCIFPFLLGETVSLTITHRNTLLRTTHRPVAATGLRSLQDSPSHRHRAPESSPPLTAQAALPFSTRDGLIPAPTLPVLVDALRKDLNGRHLLKQVLDHRRKQLLCPQGGQPDGARALCLPRLERGRGKGGA